MKTSFEQFFEISPKYKCFLKNQSARHVFEKIISKDENLIAMIDATEANKPALLACISEIEEYCKSIQDNSFDLRDNFTKQALGSMIRAALLPFGYESFKSRELPKGSSEFVSTAMTYKYQGNAKLKVVKQIVDFQ